MSIYVATASAVVGTVMQASAAKAKGKSDQLAANYNADINDRNADAADISARQLIQAEELQIIKFQNQYEELSQQTNMANSYNGWLADSGTPLKIALANAQEADEEVNIKRYNAQVGKQQLEEQGLQQTMQGNLNRMYGRAARQAGNYKAAQSLLSGISTGSQIYATA